MFDSILKISVPSSFPIICKRFLLGNRMEAKAKTFAIHVGPSARAGFCLPGAEDDGAGHGGAGARRHRVQGDAAQDAPPERLQPAVGTRRVSDPPPAFPPWHEDVGRSIFAYLYGTMVPVGARLHSRVCVTANKDRAEWV